MATERIEIDIDEMPELAALADRMSAEGKSILLKRGETEVAVLRPAPKKQATKPRKRHQPVTLDDPIFRPVGKWASDGPGDVSERKHEYLAKAYLKDHHPSS